MTLAIPLLLALASPALADGPLGGGGIIPVDPDCSGTQVMFDGSCRTWDWVRINLATDGTLDGLMGHQSAADGDDHLILIEDDGDVVELTLISSASIVAGSGSPNRFGYKIVTQVVWDSWMDDDDVVLRTESWSRDGLPLTLLDWNERTYWSGGYTDCDPSGCSTAYYEVVDPDCDVWRDDMGDRTADTCRDDAYVDAAADLVTAAPFTVTLDPGGVVVGGLGGGFVPGHLAATCGFYGDAAADILEAELQCPYDEDLGLPF